jgi:hypothetical protein
VERWGRGRGGYCERYVGRLVMKQVPARGEILKRKIKIKERMFCIFVMGKKIKRLLTA